MKEWNVVLTSHANQERRLLSELAGLGEFQSTGFREVIIGLVPNTPEFLETLLKRWQEQLFLPEMLSTVAPVRAVFPFTCLLYTSPSPRDRTRSRMPSSA